MRWFTLVLWVLVTGCAQRMPDLQFTGEVADTKPTVLYAALCMFSARPLNFCTWSRKRERLFRKRSQCR